MKELNQNSRDPEDDTDLELDGIQGAVHLETEIVESAANIELRSRFDCGSEDDTDLEFDGIEDAIHLETEIVESAASIELRSRFDCGPEDDTDLEFDGIEDKVNLELKSVDTLIDQGSLSRIDFVLGQVTPSQLDIVLEQGSPNQLHIMPKTETNEQDERLQAIYLAQQEKIENLERENQDLLALQSILEKNIYDMESVQRVYSSMNVELPDNIVLIPEERREGRDG